jgi:undecaprenyl-diphosphatase
VSWSAAVLLGVVQGLTEFLPVSSSAHLILIRAFFGWEADETLLQIFDVACHVGTLAAVVTFFWADLWRMARALPQALSASPGPDGQRLRLVVIGTIPIVIVGGLWGHVLEESVRTARVVAIPLAVGGILLLVAERARRHAKTERAMSWRDALVVGAAQATALVPGTSRSGITITAGLLMGFERAAIARFSFLLSVPAIVAAAAKGAFEMRHMALTAADLQLFAIGMVTSAAVGYVAVAFLLRYLTTHRLDVFGWYRIALAACTVVWLSLR